LTLVFKSILTISSHMTLLVLSFWVEGEAKVGISG
jgi:hypothetical protein